MIIHRGAHAACLVAAAWLAGGSFVLAENSRYPVITEAQVRQSLEEHQSTWAARVEKAGRPRLLFDKEGLEALKTRLMSGARSPETAALLAAAHRIAARGPQPYVSPEERVKTLGGSLFAADGEEWIRIAGDELVLLTVAAALDPSPELKKAVRDFVIAVCRYPTWGRNGGSTNMDLACAHAARGVALAWDWSSPDLWSPQDRELILATIGERANQLLRGLYGKIFWASAYRDNHNHVGCTGMAWCGVAFYNDIPQAPEWLAAARLDFENVARYYPEDGSSSEGVPYWSYGMNFILQYIEGTRFVIDSAKLYRSPFLKNAVAYRLNASTSGLAAILPWGDTFVERESGYTRPLIAKFAIENKDPAAAWLARQFPRPSAEFNDILTWAALWLPPEGDMPRLNLDYHFPTADIVTTRSGWGPGDYLLAVKSGWNVRNHSHLDAGALALAFGSEWLLTAPGYGSGKSSGDFWDVYGKRWLYYSNSTESHCTLLINGENQRFDEKARGTIDQFFSTPFWCFTSVDLVQAYKKVDSVRRDILHRRGDYILVYDSVVPTAPPGTTDSAQPAVTVDWLAQLRKEPIRDGNSLLVKSEAGQMRLQMLSPSEAFVSRTPTSPRVDIPGPFSSTGIHTQTVQVRGETANFIALIQPGFGSDALPPLQAEVAEQKPGFSHLILRGDGWVDHVFRNGKGENVVLDENLQASATTLAVRTEKGSITSCLAVKATALKLPDLSINPTEPADLGLQQIPDGSWILDTDKDLSGQITGKDLTVTPLKSPGDGFRYFLAKPNATPEQAEKWLSSLSIFREKAPVPVRALPPQPPLPATERITLEAENLSGQEHGKADVVDGKPGAIGKSLRGVGNNSPDHLVTWAFDVPQAGQYQLNIRYAGNLPEVKVSVLLDGAAPLPELTALSLVSTGGWSIQKDDWKALVVADATGKPLVFHLSKGRHELSLAKPSGALAIDQFEFRGAGQ